MPNIDDEIRSKTEAFARELTVLVRRAALESVSAALGSSAATYSGGFDFHHDGNAGGARDAWGVSVGWEGSIGHGPGS